MHPSERKAALRSRALGARDALDGDYREEAARRVAARVLGLRPAFRPGPVSVFWSIRSEIDTRPLIEALAAAGHELALPVAARPGLKFRRYAPGDPLQLGRFGLSEPGDDAPQAWPATMIVPLAAFDRGGHRIGYGAGYYDRAIADLAAQTAPLTIGLAFSIQEVAEVPAEAHDRALDFVVTEDEVLVCDGARR